MPYMSSDKCLICYNIIYTQCVLHCEQPIVTSKIYFRLINAVINLSECLELATNVFFQSWHRLKNYSTLFSMKVAYGTLLEHFKPLCKYIFRIKMHKPIEHLFNCYSTTSRIIFVLNFFI